MQRELSSLARARSSCSTRPRTGCWSPTAPPPARSSSTASASARRGSSASPVPIARRPASPVRFGFCGRLHAVKGLLELARAVRAIPRDVPFELQIRGPQLDDAARAFVDELRAAGRRRSARPIRAGRSGGDVPAVLADLDVLLSPSIWFENGPTIALEAMAVGTPIIASRVGNLAEIDRRRRQRPAGRGRRRRRAGGGADSKPRRIPSATIDVWRRALRRSADDGRHRARLPDDVRRMTLRASRRARVTVVTSGHLSTCPRMLKSADALRGRRLRRSRGRHPPRAVGDGDRSRRAVAPRRGPSRSIDYRRGESALTYWRTGARYRAARAAAAASAPRVRRLALVARAFGRVHPELVRAAIADDPRDLIYGGTTGALAAIAEAARRLATSYGLDLEDFHSGERAGPMRRSPTRSPRASSTRSRAAPRSSPPRSEAIAAAYRDAYGVDAGRDPQHLSASVASRRISRAPIPTRLRLYWFSQTIGPGRGLEDAVARGRPRR